MVTEGMCQTPLQIMQFDCSVQYYIALYFSVGPCNTMHYSLRHCAAIYCNLMQSSVWQFNAIKCAQRCIAFNNFQITVLHRRCMKSLISTSTLRLNLLLKTWPCLTNKKGKVEQVISLGIHKKGPLLRFDLFLVALILCYFYILQLGFTFFWQE